MSDQNPVNKPEKVWFDGNIKATMFRNKGRMNEDGTREPDFFKTAVTKLFRDNKGEWRETHYLSGTENLKAEKLRGVAYGYEQHLKARDRKQEQKRDLDRTQNAPEKSDLAERENFKTSRSRSQRRTHSRSPEPRR